MVVKHCKMVYTDGIHLTAHSIAELCDYGQKVGLDSYWLQAGRKSFHPHFVLCGKVKERVLADKNVQRISNRDFVNLCKSLFTPPENTSPENLPSESEYERMMKNIFDRAGIKRDQ